MEDNNLYDHASGPINLLHTVLTSYLGKNNWDAMLSSFTESNFDRNTPIGINKLLYKHCDLALKMDKFYSSIQKDKSYAYPSNDLMQLLYKNKQVKS